MARTAPVLAEAADVLSDQLREQLQRLAQSIMPHVGTLERRFLRALRRLKLDARQRAALAAITPGAAARVLAAQGSPGQFFEQVEYNGKRLAKLNLPPSAVVSALQEYDKLLTPTLQGLLPEDYANFDWVREQLHFCVTLTLNNAYYQVREAETQAFYELFRAELESRTLDELLMRFLETLIEFSRAECGHLFLLNGQRPELVRRASAWQAGLKRRRATECPATVTSDAALHKGLSVPRHVDGRTAQQRLVLDPSWRGVYASCWSVPLAADGKVAGVIQLAFPKTYDWLPREQELLAAAAERCLLTAEKARLIEDLARREEQVRQLAEHMLHVEEAERRRISRELHDEAGQSMLCIRLQMEMLEHGLPPEMSEVKQKLGELRDHVEHTILEIRRLIAALSPAVLEQLGLGAALRQLVNRFRQWHPTKVRLHVGRLEGLPKKTETIVYRLVQECFNNIAKHSHASTVNISVATADGMLRLNVEDDGVGFHVDEALAKRDSFGLSGIRERVALMGGKFSVRSVPAHSAAGNGARNGASKIVPVAAAAGSGAGATGEGTAVGATVAARGNGAGSGQGRLTRVDGHGGGTRDRDDDVFGASGEPGRGKSPKTGTRIQIELPVPIDEGHTGAPAAAGVARKSR